MQTLSVDRIVGQSLGNYRVERLLAHGRLSAVYLAQNVATGTNGALTLFIIPERFSPEARQRFMLRFRKEAAALTSLQHAHLLPIYEYGEHQGYPYLVTPYMTNGSLADILKREGRCDHLAVLDVLEQVTPALEYAHRKGMIHGTLKPSNIVLNPERKMLVAGFGLMHILQMRGIEANNKPYGHLLSIADTFLVAPEYIAPEVVQGQSIDKRSDIYALGVILFELLSGKPPFTGSNPLDVAKMHVEQTAPSLRTLCPDIPVALTSVVNQALDRDPARRFQSVSELAEAFAQVSAGASGSMRRVEKMPQTSPLTAADEAPETPDNGYSTGSWQFMPPIVTGKIASVNPAVVNAPNAASGRLEAPEVIRRSGSDRKAPILPERRSVEPPAQPPVRSVAPPTLVPPSEPFQPAPPAPYMEPTLPVPGNPPPEPRREAWQQPAPPTAPEPLVLRGLESDPWNASAPAWSRPAAGTYGRPPARRSQNKTMDRRKVIALLATGGVVAAGALIGVKLNLGHTGSGTAATNQTPAVKTTATKQGNAPQPKQPAANQTAIGKTTMPVNSSATFNGNKDLLIRLPNGNFVAYDRACTHEGVLVNYEPATKTIVCPAHGAIFNPTNGSVIQGPAPTAIAPVKIRVNADGTITML
jgi:serine/threonine protein kinase/Rieske Fe-S protein